MDVSDLVVLERIFGWLRDVTDEWIEIGTKHAEKGTWASLFVRATDLLDDPEGASTLYEVSARMSDVYVGACTVVGPLPIEGRGKARTRGRAGALWADLDCVAPGRTDKAYFNTVAEAVDVWDAVVPAGVGLLVNSGWGLQGWIPLDAPIPAADASTWTRALILALREEANRRGFTAGVDSVWDVTRVLRMPLTGTYNWRGGPDLPAPVRAIRVGDAMTMKQVSERFGSWWAPRAVRGRGVGGIETRTGALLDIDSAFERAGVSWADILLPLGWRLVTDGGTESETVWSRPGAEGRRSAVVYPDDPLVLVVYSDAPEAGGVWWDRKPGDGYKSRVWKRLYGAGAEWPLDVQRVLREDAEVVDTWLRSVFNAREVRAESWYETNREWL